MTVEKTTSQVEAALSKHEIPILSVRHVEASLEDVFVSVLGQTPKRESSDAT
jgi:hypothetical protein